MPGDGMDIATVSLSPGRRPAHIELWGAASASMWRRGLSERLLAQPGLAFLGPDGTRVLRLAHRRMETFLWAPPRCTTSGTRGASALTSHGSQVTLMAWYLSGQACRDREPRWDCAGGPATGEQPHLLIGHTGPIWGVRVDATGRLIASASEDGTVRIWPMPDGQPLHTWPRAALLEKLRSLTNVRVVPDASTATGYRETFLPFPGWDREPATW